MNEEQKRMAEGILAAAKAEAEGHHFYRMAAQTTGDAQGQKVFEQLAQEELEHMRFLQAQHDAIVKTGKMDTLVTLGQPHTWDGASPIFSESIRTRLADAHFEMTALSVGIQLELSAEQYYKSQADAVVDAGIKQFYRDLAAWEAGHYRALLRQQETLKEDYWSASGFAPF